MAIGFFGDDGQYGQDDEINHKPKHQGGIKSWDAYIITGQLSISVVQEWVQKGIYEMLPVVDQKNESYHDQEDNNAPKKNKIQYFKSFLNEDRVWYNTIRNPEAYPDEKTKDKEKFEWDENVFRAREKTMWGGLFYFHFLSIIRWVFVFFSKEIKKIINKMESVIPQILLIIGCYCTSVFAFIYYLENNSYFADSDADADSQNKKLI